MNTIFKNNFLYQLYFRKRYIVERERNEEPTVLPFFSQLFPKKLSLVFDIGANHGDYTYVFEKLADKVVCLEPDSHNYEFLKLRFANKPNVTIVNKAVGEKVDTSNFFIVNDGSGLNTLSKKRAAAINIAKKQIVQLTTTDNLIEQYGTPDYIKIDVEGYEINVIEGLSKKVNMISFEANLPEFLNETLDCIDKLSRQFPYVFNYEYNYRLESDKWVTAQEIKEIVKTTSSKYLNIFCKFE